MDTEQTFQRVLAHFDGKPAKLAAAIGESTPAVCNWRTRGVPARRAMAVSQLTGISVRELRPDDWHEYWPEPAGRRRKPAAEAA